MRFPSLSGFLRCPHPRLAVLLAAAALPLAAHDIITTKLTYTRDIARILATRCLSCHAENSSIPLTSYAEVRPWAVAIKEQVLSRAMPPWGAVKGFGPLAPDMALSEEEIQIVAAWVVGGAPQGDPALLPKSPAAASTSPAAEQTTSSLSVSTRLRLGRRIRLAAIHPLPDSVVAQNRITAILPAGQIEPLLWLYRYDPKWNRTFRFERPIDLPAGTVIQADSPLAFTMESTDQSARTGTLKTTVLTTPSR